MRVRSHCGMAKLLRIEQKYAAANKARRTINRKIKERGKKALRLEAKWAIEMGLSELYA